MEDFTMVTESELRHTLKEVIDSFERMYDSLQEPTSTDQARVNCLPSGDVNPSELAQAAHGGRFDAAKECAELDQFVSVVARLAALPHADEITFGDAYKQAATRTFDNY